MHTNNMIVFVLIIMVLSCGCASAYKDISSTDGLTIRTDDSTGNKST